MGCQWLVTGKALPTSARRARCDPTALLLPQVEQRKAELLELMAEAGLKPKGHVHCWQYGA